MGRKELLTKLGDEIEIENSHQDHWLINYAFTSFKPNPSFFVKITELSDKINQTGSYAEKSRSIFLTKDLHGAILATKLAKHYGADVSLYKVEEISPAKSFPFDYEFVLEHRFKTSVWKAICNQLKKHHQKIPTSDVNVLGTILYRLKHLLKPQLPLKKEILKEILEMCTKPEKIDPIQSPSTYIITIDDVIPIMRAVENYLESNKKHYTEDIEILYNILQRVDSEDEDWEETPSEKQIDELLKKRVTDKLSAQIQKSLIAHEIN